MYEQSSDNHDDGELKEGKNQSSIFSTSGDRKNYYKGPGEQYKLKENRLERGAVMYKNLGRSVGKTFNPCHP